MSNPRPTATPSLRWLRLCLALVAIGLVVWSRMQQQPRAPREVVAPPSVPAQRPVSDEPDSPEPQVSEAPATQSPRPYAVGWNVGGGKMQVHGTVVSPVVVRDQSGKVRVREEVDLAETLQRIKADRRLTQFDHDGSTFGNLEGLLPKRPRGQYREWVHPTAGIGGPGPQRVVVASDGAAWYTPDHYQSFIRIR